MKSSPVSNTTRNLRVVGAMLVFGSNQDILPNMASNIVAKGHRCKRVSRFTIFAKYSFAPKCHNLMIFIIDELMPEVMNFVVDVLKRKSITTVVR